MACICPFLIVLIVSIPSSAAFEHCNDWKLWGVSQGPLQSSMVALDTVDRRPGARGRDACGLAEPRPDRGLLRDCSQNVQAICESDEAAAKA